MARESFACNRRRPLFLDHQDPASTDSVRVPASCRQASGDPQVKSAANHQQEFIAAAWVLAMASVVTLVLARLGFPSIGFVMSVLGFGSVAERMHRVWRECPSGTCRAASIVTMLLAGVLVFAVGASSVRATGLCGSA